MLKPAQLFAQELKFIFWEIAYDEHFMFVNDGYTDDYTPGDTTWNQHEFVSLSSDNKILGYIRYNINQRSGVAYGFCAINFTKEPSIVFAKDLIKAVKDVFELYKLNKLKYSVFVGNPIERSYDALTQKYGGRIIGISKNDAKLIDGNFYDYKAYEILRENYMERKLMLEEENLCSKCSA